MNRRIIKVPDWSAATLQVGDDMGLVPLEGHDDARWVIEKIGEPYVANEQGWVDLTIIQKTESVH